MRSRETDALRMRAAMVGSPAIGHRPGESGDDEPGRRQAAAQGPGHLDSQDSRKRRSSSTSSPFRAAKGDTADGRLTVMAAGGGVEANIDRWYGQFTQPDGGSTRDRAKVKKIKVGRRGRAPGRYLGHVQGSARPDGPGRRAAQVSHAGRDHRHQDAGNYFIKFYGPERTVADNEKAFLTHDRRPGTQVADARRRRPDSSEHCRRAAGASTGRSCRSTPGIACMKTQQFLEHHGIRSNPFAEEDAQTDPVFKEHCIASTYHPTWDKIYGDPAEPATSIVFGEKGSGKTAMRLQIVRHLSDYNRNASQRSACSSSSTTTSIRFSIAFAIASARAIGGPIACSRDWKLWDHMDAILSLGVTGLVDRILEAKQHQRSARPTSSAPSDLRIARPPPGARSAAAGGLLRPIDGRNVARALAPAAPQAALSHLARPVGLGLGRCW